MTIDDEKIIIFSQAPADIKYVIDLYEKWHISHKIMICVTGVINNYRYLQSLNLNSNLLFIPLFTMKNPFNVVRQKLILGKIYKGTFQHYRGAKIYFNSKHFDFGTYYFLRKLHYSNTVYFFDLYKHKGDITTSFPLRYILKKLLLNCIVGNHISYMKVGAHLFPIFDYSHMKIEEIVLKTNPDNLSKYMFEVQVPFKRSILFFESNGQMDTHFVDYGKTLDQVLDVFRQSGFEVFIKPHPRIGYSRMLDDHGFIFIESYVPGEMIQIENFDYVIGFASTSLTIAIDGGKTKALSLIDLLDYKSADNKAMMKEYLLRFNDSLYFVQTLDELQSLLTADIN